ncbi:dihydrofolate reductase family protein [Deminuibacter soli]|uniref:Bacterial bifunctional deaminase-reductase C-terminal domain-containing protein n=1 Tax=Deminuibacter soli TaxID=2291815 RepID=A0A3E1NK37_9BACT|nr:dihydrofolate reductase family protein [Deminuibacter soli]RFM28305.1 hypothetical protein DXN05_12400 [Deminuibacter soli]
MGKIIVLINTTPDGFCDSDLVIADGEFHGYVHDLLANTQTVAFGRNTFELFQQVWPGVLANSASSASQLQMAQALHDIDKVVFSTSLHNTQWHNSTIAKELNTAAMQDFKQNSDKNILTIGSPGLVAELTKAQLADEYHFALQPTIAGGKAKVRLFDKTSLESRQALQFKATKALKSGVVINHYITKN